MRTAYAIKLDRNRSDGSVFFFDKKKKIFALTTWHQKKGSMLADRRNAAMVFIDNSSGNVKHDTVITTVFVDQLFRPLSVSRDDAGKTTRRFSFRRARDDLSVSSLTFCQCSCLCLLVPVINMNYIPLFGKNVKFAIANCTKKAYTTPSATPSNPPPTNPSVTPSFDSSKLMNF